MLQSSSGLVPRGIGTIRNMSPRDEFITRVEYETRHSELRAELLKLDAEQTQNFRSIQEQTERDRKDIQTKFDLLKDKLDKATVSVWKLITVSLINLVAGGGLTALIVFIVQRK